MTATTTPVAAIWAMSALGVITTADFVYLSIFFVMLFSMSWGVVKLFKVIYELLYNSPL